MRVSVVRSCVMLAVLASCSSQSSTAPRKTTSHLTAPEAQAITQSLAQVASTDPAIRDLVDSITVAIQAGVGFDTLDLTTDLGAGPFYGIALKRAFPGASSFAATFDIIAFDNPSAPQNLIIIDALVGGSTLPDSVNASFDGSSGDVLASGHLIQVSGDSALSWSATQGTVSFAGSGPNGACASFQSPAGITCAQETMHITFSITATTPDFGTTGGAQTASFPGGDVPGVVLTFSPQSPIQ